MFRDSEGGRHALAEVKGFGMPTGCTQTATPVLFTGHELDSESNLSQSQYRKYAALEARWATPDPAGVNGPPAPVPSSFDLGPAAAGAPGDLEPESPVASLAEQRGFGLTFGAVCAFHPQSWNGYSYVENQPSVFAERSGLYRTSFWGCFGRCMGIAQLGIWRACRWAIGFQLKCVAAAEAAVAALCLWRCH